MSITNLPNPGMDFTPLAPLTAEQMDDIVENIEAINNATIQTGSIADGAITKAKLGADATSNLNYSTSEVDTGATWIDGSKIYKKTIVMNESSWTSGTGFKSQAHGISNLSKIVGIEPLVDDGSGFYSTLIFAHNSSGDFIRYYIDSSEITVEGSGLTGYTFYITIHYTKSS